MSTSVVKGGDDISKLPVNNSTPPTEEELFILKQIFPKEPVKKSEYTDLAIESAFIAVLFLFLYSPVIDKIVYSFGVYKPSALLTMKFILFIVLYISFRKLYLNK
jgi:hypothetical protein